MARRKQTLKKSAARPAGTRRLKVFKTPIGFHDAYVAAPSRKAALAAWGANTDLFSAGIAEQVSDAGKAMQAVLAKPGEVVRLARGGGKEERPSSSPGRAKGKATKSRPRPSRAGVGKAEAAVAELEKAQAAERAALAKDEERLAKRRRALEEKQRRAMARAEAKRDAAGERYRKAMAEWTG